MFLTYGDLAKLFPKRRGIRNHELSFHTVATFSTISQPKGIFIPIEENSGQLNEAIGNGAIAALWDEEMEVPKYVPNHFPIFYTNDLLKGLKDMMELYIEKINQQEKAENKVTNFLFSNEILLKEKKSTYDIAVMAGEIKAMNKLHDGKEGAK